MKAAFYTLGCKVNQYETQIMEQQLKAAGYEIVDPDGFADVYIVNSCTVTAESDRKTRQILRRLKARNKDAIAALCGCFPQSAAARAADIPEADIVAGTRERAQLVNLIEHARASGERIVAVSSYQKGEAFEPMRAESFYGRTRAFVKIEDGCESFCSYCIIPKARGPVRSKPAPEITQELSGLARQGFKEAVLVGINLSSYGRDSGAALHDALIAACASPIERVRLGSLEPNIITPRFIDTVLSQKKVCPHFHLALQSGCAATLARMNRKYTPAQYKDAVRMLREALPHCAVTTDIIVGFPGETEEEFAQSLAFAREIGFAQAHVFVFSRREGTRAATMPDQVEKAEKVRRSRVMTEACGRSRADFLAAHVGGRFPVLFEAGENGGFEGFAPDYTPVRVQSAADLHGKIIETHITGCDGEGCTGSVAIASFEQ